MSMFRARSALPYSPFHRSALLGQSLTGRPAGAGLLANAMRVRLGRLAAGCGQPPAVASNSSIYKNGCPLCRFQHTKIFPSAALPSLLLTMLEKRGQNFAFLHNNLPKNQCFLLPILIGK